MRAWINRVNDHIAASITKVVGTMWCAYVFALIALSSLKENLDSTAHFIAWFSSQFLQLVLLSIIMVGTQYLNKASDQRAQQDHETLISELAEIKQMHAAQAEEMSELKAIHIEIHAAITTLKGSSSS